MTQKALTTAETLEQGARTTEAGRFGPPPPTTPQPADTTDAASDKAEAKQDTQRKAVTKDAQATSTAPNKVTATLKDAVRIRREVIAEHPEWDPTTVDAAVKRRLQRL